MIRPEDNEQDEQQKLDQAQGGDDSFEEDSDYFSFDRVRDRALGSEYGADLSRDDTMDDTGTYKFDTDDELNLQEIFTKREKIYTYHYLRDVINGMEPNNVFPNLEDLEQSKLMTNLRRRIGTGGVFLGFDFVKDGTTTPLRIIVRKRDPITKRLTDGFEFNKAENSDTARKIFRDRLETARKKYRDRPSGMIEDEVRSVLSMESDATDWSTATEGSRESEDTGNTVQENPDQDEDQDEEQSERGSVLSAEEQQDNRERAEVIEEEVEATKFEIIEEIEGEMTWNRDFVIGRFAKLLNDKVKIESYGGEKDYLIHVEEVVRPISDMEFYKNQDFFTDNDMTADQLYDQQMKFLEDTVQDIDKRIAAEEKKGAFANRDLIKAYKKLKEYIEVKFDTLNIYFERPVKAEYFKRQVRRLVKKNSRLAFERGKKWVKAKFPEFLAGITVSIGTIVFCIYELAENMGRGIVEQGQKALKNLGKKIKELAAKQGGAIGAMLHVVGSLLEHGAEGLNVLRDHFIAVAIIIILIITGSYYHFKGPKVRVKRRDK